MIHYLSLVLIGELVAVIAIGDEQQLLPRFHWVSLKILTTKLGVKSRVTEGDSQVLLALPMKRY